MTSVVVLEVAEAKKPFWWHKKSWIWSLCLIARWFLKFLAFTVMLRGRWNKSCMTVRISQWTWRRDRMWWFQPVDNFHKQRWVTENDVLAQYQPGHRHIQGHVNWPLARLLPWWLKYDLWSMKGTHTVCNLLFIALWIKSMLHMQIHKLYELCAHLNALQHKLHLFEQSFPFQHLACLLPISHLTELLPTQWPVCLQRHTCTSICESSFSTMTLSRSKERNSLKNDTFLSYIN